MTITDADGNLVAQTHKDDGADRTLQIMRDAVASRPEWAGQHEDLAIYDRSDVAQRTLLELDRRFDDAPVAERARAVPMLQQWLLEHPEPDHPCAPLARVLLGEALYNAGRFEEAASTWVKMRDLFPRHPLRHRAYYLLLDRETWPVAEHPHVRDAPYPSAQPVDIPDPDRRARNLALARSDERYVWSPSGVPFVYVPPGSYTMGGSPPVHENEKPKRRVTLTRGFWLAAWPVTRALYRELHPERWPGSTPGTTAGELPATRLNYADVLEFIGFISARDGVPYRLPTEAEQEYAMRGGLDEQPYPWGDAPLDPSRCNYDRPRPVPVACYAANGYGIFDAVGNTFEWTADRYSPEAYSLTPSEVSDPAGPTADQAPKELYVCRASGCGSPFAAVLARTGWRVGFDASRRDGANGMRLCSSERPG